MRTTSGSWRVAHDFPNLPAWIVKSVGGSTVHWAGASLRSTNTSSKVKTVYGDIAGANLLDWPITLAEMEPWYAKAEFKMGTTRTNGIPGLPGNNNFKVMELARASSATSRSIPAGCRLTVSRATGAARVSRSASASKAANQAPSGRPSTPGFPKVRRPAILKFARTAWRCRIEHNAAGKVDGVVYVDADGKVQKQKPAWLLSREIHWKVRLLLNSHSNMFPDGLANSSARSAATICGT